MNVSRDSSGKTSRRKRLVVDAVADIETQDWTTFVAGGVLFADGAYEARDFRHEDDYADLLFSIEGNLWMHNGGRFDAKWLLDRAIERDLFVRVVAAGSRIVSMRLGALRVYDSKALTMLSLEDFTDGAGVEKEVLDLPCVDKCAEKDNVWKDKKGRIRKGCGGYCAISRTMPRHLFRRMMDYLEADCRSLWAALGRLSEFADTNDLDLGITVGSSAWGNAKRWLELPNAPLDGLGEHLFARDAYYGGRVQLFRPRSGAGYEADVNSMYPSRLAYCKLPTGKFSHVYGKDARTNFDSGKEGVYRARVNVPEMHLPPLPYRQKQGERISYPTGQFCGTWTAPELRYAMSLGVEASIFECISWSNSEIVFKPWVDKLFALRAGAPGGKSGPLGTFLKFYLNSLTGKLGARPDVEEVIINPPDDKFVSCHCKVECDGMCGAFFPIGISPGIYSAKRYRVMPCAHVEWSAYLTSEARIEWHRQAVSQNDGWDMVYGDTDSVFCETARTRNIGKELGEWESKGSYTEFRGWAPKLYTYKREEKRTVKGKGLRLPRNPEKALGQITSGMAFGSEAVIGFWKGARKGKFFEAETMKRLPKEGYGDRILEPHSKVTRAPTIEEVLDAEKQRAMKNGRPYISL